MLKILKKEDLGDEIAVVVGTRPGIVKFSPVIRELRSRKAPYFIIHTGQHYSFNMDRQFFEDLDLPLPRYSNDRVRKQTLHGAQTAEMIRGVEEALLDAKPRIVIVGGDANTNLAAALATRKLCIHLCIWKPGSEAMTGKCRKNTIELLLIIFLKFFFLQLLRQEKTCSKIMSKGKYIL